MKRIPRGRKRLATTRTTSTTGPHVLLVQNFGVAKTTTNGRWAAMLCATEYRRRSRSGGVLVVSRAKLPCVLAIVGVCDGYARAPTAGDALLALTARYPSAPIRLPPIGRASTRYRPGWAMWSRAT